MRYARALLKASTEAKLEDKVYGEMSTLAQSYIDVARLRSAIDNPMLAAKKKKELLVAACGGKVSDIMSKFLDLVLREGRESVLQFIANSFVTLYRQQKNIIRGSLTTAVAVSPQTEMKVRRMVEARTNGTVEFQTEVNPDIIGGFVLEYDTYRLDASVKSQLRSILTQIRK